MTKIPSNLQARYMNHMTNLTENEKKLINYLNEIKVDLDLNLNQIEICINKQNNEFVFSDDGVRCSAYDFLDAEMWFDDYAKEQERRRREII